MSGILDPWGHVRVTRTGRRHRIGTGHILAALDSAATVERQVGGAILFVGKDDRGVELEIVAVPDDRYDGGLAVIHVMPTVFRRQA